MDDMTIMCGMETRTRQQPNRDHEEICGAWTMYSRGCGLERRANADTCTVEYDDMCHVRDD